MAKSKNSSQHNQSKKAHRNGIKKPKTSRYPSLKGTDPKFRRNHRHALHGTMKALKEFKEGAHGSSSVSRINMNNIEPEFHEFSDQTRLLYPAFCVAICLGRQRTNPGVNGLPRLQPGLLVTTLLSRPLRPPLDGLRSSNLNPNTTSSFIAGRDTFRSVTLYCTALFLR
ncbi:hypothetical protein LZ554_006172 [Drepanopeziza brunnea f. sp. 'monogermtubi']|nr:hypothetical protein LZ554_006172 [Drepanopeziza brunnea f. sp. 'monogermtubi']